MFDGVADFDRATTNPRTGEMRDEFVPDNTAGGPGDKLHPNRLGYQAMGMAIDLSLFGVRATMRTPANLPAVNKPAKKR